MSRQGWIWCEPGRRLSVRVTPRAAHRRALTFALHPFIERAHGFKVGVLERVVGDNEARDLDLARLEELVQAVGIFLVAEKKKMAISVKVRRWLWTLDGLIPYFTLRTSGLQSCQSGGMYR